MEGVTNLRAKLCAIMGEIGYIEKRGRNAIQNYDYVMAADVAATAAKLLSKWGVAFWPSQESLEWETRQTQKGTAMFVCRARITFTFADTESDERIEIPCTGEGQDTGDKAAYKARTGALKYCLLQTFLIAAGDDPEGHEEGDVDTKAPENVPRVADTPAQMACPECGKLGSIIVSKPEFGGGFVCYKAKGGCGAKFRDTDTRFSAGGPNTRGGDVSSGGNGRSLQHMERPERVTITEDQVKQLENLCDEMRVSPLALIKQYAASDKTIERLADLTVPMFNHAINAFEARRAKLAKQN